MPDFPSCPHEVGRRMLGAIGAERRSAPSPGPPRRRGSRGEVKWPDSRVLTFPSDAPCVVLDHPELLADLIGISAWDPLPTSNRRGGRSSRLGSRADRGSQPPWSKSQERVPADNLSQPGHASRHPRFAQGTRPPRVRQRSASDSSDICPTCQHGATSDSAKEDNAEAVPKDKVRNRPSPEEPPFPRPSPGPVHGHRPPCAGCGVRGLRCEKDRASWGGQG